LFLPARLFFSRWRAASRNRCSLALWSGGTHHRSDCTLYGPAARVREGVEQWRAGITTPVLVPLSPDGNQMNGLMAVFAALER
jgi:hypothetical protein